jgi:alkylation response protein AidB-like acyl-CoA dehydrogenase
VERLYALERGDAQLDASDLRELADLGWLALLAPADVGGAHVAALEAGVVMDECGYAAASLPLTVSNVAASVMAAAPASFAGHLGALASGGAQYTIDAANRRRAGPPADPLRRERSALVGSMWSVPFGATASFALAPVQIDGASAFALIALEDAKRENVSTLDRCSSAHVRFDRAAEDAVCAFASGDLAEELRERCDALVTAFSVLEMAGLLQRVLEMTVEYISNRVQFGQPIAKFQAARHRAAELLTLADTVRWTAYHALWTFEQDPHDTSEIWHAKHWATRAAERAFQVSHLLHGGVGVGTEYPLHLYTQALAAQAVRAGGMDEMVSRTLERLPIAPRAMPAEESQA